MNLVNEVIIIFKNATVTNKSLEILFISNKVSVGMVAGYLVTYKDCMHLFMLFGY